MTSRVLLGYFALALVPLSLPAEKFYTYVGDIGPGHVLIAWGTTDGSNTIGRSSRPHGKATVKIGGQTVTTNQQNYLRISGLAPDTEYEYEVSLNGNRIGHAKIHTWPLKSERLCFFVMGDWGNGSTLQYQVANVIWKQLQERWGTECPPRFVLTTGDNIYGHFGFTLRFRSSGNRDSHWEDKFYKPYESVIARIPFYASLGNHDGNESENRGDLAAYLDNFFFPSPKPARYYRFSYGGFADFFALDSTTNTERGPSQPAYLKNSEQDRWLAQNLSESQVPWKIPYFHHPPFNAGPRHAASAEELEHFLETFKKAGVKVVFTGHEHNFQFTEANRTTGGIRYIVTGAGGELRSGNVQRLMQRAQIEGWAPQAHFLAVDINRNEMKITPLSFEPVTVYDRNGGKIEMPLEIERSDSPIPFPLQP
ncbi:MAG: metallophosphoesterase [Bryobacteraceae bacterium]